MRNKETARLRAAWIPQARSEVLEIGIGSGLNLPFYSHDVQRVYGVDPSVELQRMARKKRLAEPTKLEFLLQSAEDRLPLPDSSFEIRDSRFDTAIITWTLCPLDAPRALQQVNRVLKMSGRLIFVQHGNSPDLGVAVWQERLTPLWKRIGGGCHLNR
jgi:ubiquinone/menaquinone biosynthesis C-methylase UbiE